MALWVVAILFVLAVGLAYRVGLELHLTRYAQDRLKAFYIARAGLEWASAFLNDENAHSIYAFQASAQQEGESPFKESPVGDGFFSVHYVLRSEGTEEIQYGMQDEESRIPLNTATAEVFQKVPGLEEELIVSLRAWRGDPGLTQAQLARENDYYATLEKPYPRKGKLFQTLEELLLVKGMTPSRFEEVKPYFTVYGSAKVNLNTAPVTTLEILGLDPEIARRLVRARLGEDGVMGTEDDYLFEDLSDVSTPEFSALLGLIQDQPFQLTSFISTRQPLLTVSSTAFRIQVEGRLRRGGVRKEIVAIVDRSAGKGTLRYWHEN